MRTSPVASHIGEGSSSRVFFFRPLFIGAEIFFSPQNSLSEAKGKHFFRTRVLHTRYVRTGNSVAARRYSELQNLLERSMDYVTIRKRRDGLLRSLLKERSRQLESPNMLSFKIRAV